MPIPTPNADESKKEYMERCASTEYERLKDDPQHEDKSKKKLRDMAGAICNDKWQEHKNK
jgi:hypothetical protein